MLLKRKGLMLIISSPSGAGKSTLSRMLLKLDSNIKLSVSSTTRPARTGETDGVDYNFISQDVFAQMVGDDKFLEHATVFENSYGTPRESTENALSAGRDILFDIDWQGTLQLQEKCPDDVVTIFILPPSIAELESRLRKRNQDSDEVIAHRMSEARNEISKWHHYDYIIVNDDLDISLQSVRSILQAERLKRNRLQDIHSFIDESLG